MLNFALMRIGIFFGGNSREREISFAGGRTVYDNLNKALFEPVPIFVDSFGNFIKVKWEYLYKGSIRDFYPPAYAANSTYGFQFYAESLGPLTKDEELELSESLGEIIPPHQLSEHIDLAFLALHGRNGEDGRLQGLLEWMNIPYTGSSIFPSVFGMNKFMQKELMESNFNVPNYLHISRTDWLSNPNKRELFHEVVSEMGLPMVVKAANQGSSIGVTVLEDEDFDAFFTAVNRAFFIEKIYASAWREFDREERHSYIRTLVDIRTGIGLPLTAPQLSANTIYHPDVLLDLLNEHFLRSDEAVELFAEDAEHTVLLEAFIKGKEFSCIVVQNMDGEPVALPPTGIVKGGEIYDYRSKYLPGLSRKVTPIDLPEAQIQHIRKECERLFSEFAFNVYARVDGFILDDGTVFLNDPNTTSGMLPSSFFFHQAAEIGLNPSQFLTYIIRKSLEERANGGLTPARCNALVAQLDESLSAFNAPGNQLKKVAVIMGGYSSERHISVESGRNVYEKLASSGVYQPISIFLKGDANQFELVKIPINLHLKDNADDISEKIEHYNEHPIIHQIKRECKAITDFFAAGAITAPQSISFDELKSAVDVVFIALHGRPGEDGTLQQELIRVGLPFNGSLPHSSEITINKYQTKEILKSHGFIVAQHRLVSEDAFLAHRDGLIDEIEAEFPYPFIAKPVDDGCSSAVKKVKNREELIAFMELIFRKGEELMPGPAGVLHLKLNEEFPNKRVFLVEELITSKGAKHFLEVTGGMLTHFREGQAPLYETFEPSESVAESEVLSLEEKFLAGEGLNITPARYDSDPEVSARISAKVQADLKKAAQVLKVEGYCRIDAFVRIFDENHVETIVIEVNSLPGMTPATCIFHQCAINGYKPFEFIDKILEYGSEKKVHGFN